MLSPRTLSLRIQNRSLLMSLDNCMDLAQQKASPDIKGNSLRASFKSREEDCAREEQNGLMPMNHHPYDQANPMRIFSDSFVDRTRSLKEYQPAEKMENSKKLICDSHPVNHSSFTSFDDLRAVVREVTAEVRGNPKKKFGNSNSSIKKNCMRSSNSTGKSICVEQLRVAEAQMHAPTHSHSISKCYCILNNAKSHPDSKYIIQLYGRKQRIPPRLKKQRYQAESSSNPSRVVKWADSSNYTKEADEISLLPQQQSFEMTETSSRTSTNRCVSPQVYSLNQSTECCHPEKNLLDRVKHFRESHWTDCHAVPRNLASPSEHECVQHYVLNNRLFLEPLYTNYDKGDGSCPVCLLSDSDVKLTHSHDRIQLPNPHNQASHIMVTLPKLILEESTFHDFKEGTYAINEKKRVQQKPCFLVGHHSLVANEKSKPFPSDSLALRYQKK